MDFTTMYYNDFRNYRVRKDYQDIFKILDHTYTLIINDPGERELTAASDCDFDSLFAGGNL